MERFVTNPITFRATKISPRQKRQMEKNGAQLEFCLIRPLMALSRPNWIRFTSQLKLNSCPDLTKLIKNHFGSWKLYWKIMGKKTSLFMKNLLQIHESLKICRKMCRKFQGFVENLRSCAWFFVRNLRSYPSRHHGCFNTKSWSSMILDDDFGGLSMTWETPIDRKTNNRGSACSWIFNRSGIFWMKVTSFLGEVCALRDDLRWFFSACDLASKESPVISPSNPATCVFFLQLFIAIPIGTNTWNKYGKMMKNVKLVTSTWTWLQVAPALAPPSVRFEAPAKLQDLVSRGDECHHGSSSNQHKLVGESPINPPQLEFTRRTSQDDLGKCGMTMDSHGFHTWNHSLLDLRVEVHREVPATGKSQGASDNGPGQKAGISWYYLLPPSTSD